LVYQKLQEDPPSVSEFRSDLPEGLDRIVDRALSKDPRDRYHNMSEMLHDLDLVRKRVVDTAALDDDKLIAGWRLSRRARRAIAVVAVVAVLGGAGWYLWPFGGDAAPRIMVVKWENTFHDPGLDWVSGAIMSGLIRTLGDLDGYNVISRQTVAATVQAIGQASGGSIGFTAAQEVGASYLITGAIAREGLWISLDCELANVTDGTLVDSWSTELRDSTRIHRAVADLAVNIGQALGARWRRDPRDIQTGVRSPTTSTSALKHYQLALAAEERRDIRAALQNLRSAVALDSTFTEAHLHLARLAEDIPEEREHLTAAMKYRLRSPPIVRKLVEAENLRLNGDIIPAIELYEDIVGEDPENVTARKALGRLYERIRRFSDAASEYSVLATISPFDYSYYREWAMIYAEIGRPDKAVELITDWRRRLPNQEAPIRDFLYLCERLGAYREGVALCDSLSAADPESPPFVCGWLFSHVGRLREAERIYQRLIESPDASIAQSRGFAYLAWLSYRREEYTRGLGYIEKAMEHQDEFYYHWLAGMLAAAAGQFELAENHAESIKHHFDLLPEEAEVVEAKGKRRFYYHLKGCIALDSGRPTEAVTLFEEALRYTSRIDDPEPRLPGGVVVFGRDLCAQGGLPSVRKGTERAEGPVAERGFR
jgi:tetratricopeptide (TPR) repeat protein